MARGKKVYIRPKKTEACKGQPWDEKKRLETLTTYVATGGVPMTSAITGVPKETIKKWKTQEWWKQGLNDLQYEDNIKISAKLSKVLEKSLAAVEDRLDNGEHMYDPRTGNIIRVPAKLRDVHKVTTDIVEKKQQLLKMHVKEELKTHNPQTVTADHLVQLAQAFAQMATGQKPSPTVVANEIIEGEHTEVLDALGYEVPSK